MTEDEFLDEMRACDALLEGHFILSSGLRSSRYLQCARFLMDANRAERACSTIAAKLRELVGDTIDMVISPAMGGVIVGYEMGRQLGKPSVFFERVDGEFTLRRGFELPEGVRCVMVEDVITTGLSSRECIEAARKFGANVVAGCCLVDRSGGKADIGVPLVALASLDVPNYSPDELPDDLKKIPAVKPGSRGLN